jgi:tRNA(Ile)-lysidine synthase
MTPPRRPAGTLPFDHSLVEAGARVLVALSGGVDSLVLLHHLRFGRADVHVIAAHLDHGMRDSSAADARWVAGLCNAWQVPLFSDRLGVAPVGEGAARAARYAFLRHVADVRHARLIATAHHLDDQAETVLLRAIRGAGLRGMRGIAPRRGPLVRPLLAARRQDIEAYAADARIQPREDPTNVQLRYARNRIRHRVLPELERAHQGAAGALARLADNARLAEAALNSLLARVEAHVVTVRSDRAVQLARADLLSYHPAVRLHLLRRLLRTFGSVPGQTGTRAALEFISGAASGKWIELPGGIRLERSFGQFVLEAPADDVPEDVPVVIDTADRGAAAGRIGGRRIEVRWGDDTATIAVASVRLELGALEFPLLVRGWQPGDRIATTGGTKKLKKIFVERRVGRRERASIPVVADATGRVLWVVGIARSTAAPGPGDGLTMQITVVNVEPT